MTKKIKVSARPIKTIFIVQMIIIPLFMIFGIFLFSVADKEVKPFVFIFILIYELICVAIFINAVNMLRKIKNGKMEVAEINGVSVGEQSDFAVKLRELDALKKDAIISESEYQKKKVEIMQKKW